MSEVVVGLSCECDVPVVTGSTRRSVETGDSSETAASNDGSSAAVSAVAADADITRQRRSMGRPPARPACDDYRPSVISTTDVPGDRSADESSSTNPRHCASQTLQVQPTRRSANGKRLRYENVP